MSFFLSFLISILSFQPTYNKKNKFQNHDQFWKQTQTSRNNFQTNEQVQNSS